MKKVKRLLMCGAAVLPIFLMTFHGVALPQENGNKCQGEGTIQENCPNIHVEVRPAYITQSPADHTYVKFTEGNGNWESFPCFGKCTGGKLLEETESFTLEDNKKIAKYMASNKPCRWPKKYYLIFGVCHQLANRSLFHTEKTVKKARMYKLSSFFYYTYGNCFWPLKQYCMNNCQEASEALGSWKPGIPPGCTPSMSGKRSPTEPNDEYLLYVKLFGNLKEVKDSMAMKDLFRAYRDELFALFYQQRIGDKNKADYLPILISGHEELVKQKEKLDRRLYDQKEEVDEDIIYNDYNMLFNSALSQLREKLPTDIYEQFFGLKKSQTVDVRWFKPSDGE